ncbi:MAG TPA: hypothetical protein DHV62_01585, partial [Elusimicrobia bacterium]|nr:hypothetical protein [Elusimicrobiota bacterium]
MEKNLILKSQANEIFEEIQRRGLDPSQFQWEERDSELHGGGLLVSALIHRPTQYYFIFDRRYEERYTVRSPGRDTGIDKREVSSWVGQRQHVLEWLNCLKREIEAPDLWGAISQETKLAETASTSGASNT